jgi:ADP-heptose:LPS heptosyltransferase
MDRTKALLIYSGWLGDLVWIIPTLKALRKQFQTLSLVVSDVQGQLALGIEGTLLDKVYVGSRNNRSSVARQVRQDALSNGIGTFIDIKGRGKAGLFIPWRWDIEAFIPSRQDAREYALAKLLHPFASSLPTRDASRHMVDAYLSMTSRFGVVKSVVDFQLAFPERVIDEANRLAQQEGFRSGKTIAISPGSAQFSKIWPAKNFRALADILVCDMGCTAVIMGARSFAPNNNYDVEVSRAYFNDKRFVNLVERTDILVDSYLFQTGMFDVAVGNDSFAGHMAGSATEVEAGSIGAAVANDGRCFHANLTVSLFGPTNPRFCRPYDPTGQFNEIVQPAKYPENCPYNKDDHVCQHYGDKTCLGPNHCMEGISVEQVVLAVEKQLAKASAFKTTMT